MPGTALWNMFPFLYSRYAHLSFPFYASPWLLTYVKVGAYGAGTMAVGLKRLAGGHAVCCGVTYYCCSAKFLIIIMLETF